MAKLRSIPPRQGAASSRPRPGAGNRQIVSGAAPSRSAALSDRRLAIALTGYADPGDALRAHAAGFQMHLAKPVSPAELLRGIARLGGRLDPR
jgi:CheY-like chemotaxis protein